MVTEELNLRITEAKGRNATIGSLKIAISILEETCAVPKDVIS